MFRFIALAAVSATMAFAGSVTITGAAVYSDTDSSCSDPNGVWPSCGSNAFVSGADASANTPFLSQNTFGSNIPDTGQPLDFAGAFNLWNNANGDLWTLVNGGPLDVTLNVQSFTAFAASDVGGIGPNNSLATGIDVTVTRDAGYTGPAMSQLFWAQGLLINYDPGLPGNEPYNTNNTYETMDSAGFNGIAGCVPLATPGANNATPSTVVTAGTSCGPVYPYQYSNGQFYDAPLGPYPNASFRAEALLATVTISTNAQDVITGRTLTVYDGISYGFDVYAAPEPATWALAIAGLALVAVRRARRSRVNAI